MSINLSETLVQTKKRCAKKTKRELVAEVNETIGVAKELYDTTQGMREVIKSLRAAEHCYNGVREELACAAKVLHVLSGGPIPPTFVTHMAQYLELIGE